MKTEINPSSEEVNRALLLMENREICRTAVGKYRLDVRRRGEIKSSDAAESGLPTWRDCLVGILLCASVVASAIYVAISVMNTPSGLLRGIVITAGSWMLAGMGGAAIFLVACEVRDRWGKQ